MKFKLCAIGIVVLCSAVSGAQVASHAPTSAAKPAVKSSPGKKASVSAAPQVTGKTVAKVNGTALTDRDLIREMYALFPYAQQHNGFPKDLEPEIRRGALQMIIFDELVYQEGKRRNIPVSVEKVAAAEKELRKQFATAELYQQFLNQEAQGSSAVLREKIRRSLLIESVLKSEVTNKAALSAAQLKSYYDKNPGKFARPETIHIQSVSILPPNSNPDVLKEARKRAEEALKKAKAAKSYGEFGLVAEKFSDDDYRVKMGDHKPVEKDKLPPEVVKVALAMKPGEISDLIQLGNAYTIIRLVDHKLAGKVPFEEVKSSLRSDLEKQNVEQLRSALGKRLRANAKIEVM
ncbi:MAG TPA: peptidyl-prolyl cis-trans isomerase [Terriglobales bacterium]